MDLYSKNLNFQKNNIIYNSYDGVDCFAVNEVIKYFDSEVHGELKNAEHLDKNGLFIGNHHYPIMDALNSLKNL